MNEFRQEKVNFELEIEGEGFPPISVETLNGFSQKEGVVRLDNTPFFVTGIALGDLISCRHVDGASGCYFDGVIEHKGNKAISVIFIKQDSADDIFQNLKALGCYCEYGEFGDLCMLAICVYKDQDYRQVSSYLNSQEDKDILSFAELCI